MRVLVLSLVLLCFAKIVYAQGNTWNTSFVFAKHTLEELIYINSEMRTTLYCNATFDDESNLSLPSGFEANSYESRAQRLEWEHIVPAENLGRNILAWTEGDELCIDSEGATFKGRRCAEKVNQDYQYMQADMYNLFPAVGAVNALRSNYDLLPRPNDSEEESDFGSCHMIVQNRQAYPPNYAKGQIARTYIYMDNAYPLYSMSESQRQIMQIWNAEHPVTEEECLRTSRIEAIQGNENSVVKQLCLADGLW